MNSDTEAQSFLSSDAARLLRNRPFVESLLAVLPFDSSILYDLTFKASFAKKLFAVLKREGPAIQGYDRMQQTLAESVEQLTRILQQVENDNAIRFATHYTPVLIMEMLDDLTTLKEWMNLTDKP